MSRSIAGIAALAAVGAAFAPPPAQSAEQSNDLTRLPRSISLGDIDGDGAAELLMAGGSRLLAARSNFEGSAVLHHYFEHDIRRVIVGDFTTGGREHGKDQVCVVLADTSLRCYAISDDRSELWWWFTQPSFLATGDRAIVGDFDGDGDDDVLAHNPSTGSLRAYTRNSSGTFASMAGFALGNLADADLRGKRLYAGEFGQAAGRDDLLVHDPATGQVSRYDAVTDSAERRTFWWAFTTAGNAVRSDEQLTVANLDGGTQDGLILRNETTGKYRFKKVE